MLSLWSLLAYLQIHNRIGAVALAAEQHEIAMQIACIQTRYRQTVAVAGQRHRVDIVGGGRLRRRAVHVLEQLVDLRARNAATAVGDLHRDVLVALRHRHLNRRHRDGVLAVVLHHGAHGILEDLEQHVVEMRWYVHDANGGARMDGVVLDEPQFGAGEVVLVAQEARILVGVLHDGGRIADGIDAADVAAVLRNVAEENGCGQ